MKFLHLAFLFLWSVPSFAQAPSCSTQTVVGTCVNGFLVDGRHYVYDSAGKVIQIRLYLDGKFVGTALVHDSTVVQPARPEIITVSQFKLQKIEFPLEVKFKVDSVEYTVDCGSCQMDSVAHPINIVCAITFNGEGYWALEQNGLPTRTGYFKNGKLQCGVEYVYKKGKLRSVNVYREGKITRTVKVSKAKKKK